MPPTHFSLSDMAAEAGLSLTVEMSKDLARGRYVLSGDAEPTMRFDALIEAYHWLDGYHRGVARGDARASGRPG